MYVRDVYTIENNRTARRVVFIQMWVSAKKKKKKGEFSEQLSTLCVEIITELTTRADPSS